MIGGATGSPFFFTSFKGVKHETTIYMEYGYIMGMRIPARRMDGAAGSPGHGRRRITNAHRELGKSYGAAVFHRMDRAQPSGAVDCHDRVSAERRDLLRHKEKHAGRRRTRFGGLGKPESGQSSSGAKSDSKELIADKTCPLRIGQP